MPKNTQVDQAEEAVVEVQAEEAVVEAEAVETPVEAEVEAEPAKHRWTEPAPSVAPYVERETVQHKSAIFTKNGQIQ